MISLSGQLDRITESDREALMYAFEQLQPMYIVLHDGTFVGVHITKEPNLIVEQVGGAWSIGRVKSGSNQNRIK